MPKWIKDNWLLVTLIFSIGAFAARTELQLQSSQDQVSELSRSIDGVRKAVLRLTTDGDPRTMEVLEELLSGDPRVQEGFRLFNQGEYEQASSLWLNEANRGNPDAQIVVSVGEAALDRAHRFELVPANGEQKALPPEARILYREYQELQEVIRRDLPPKD